MILLTAVGEDDGGQNARTISSRAVQTPRGWGKGYRRARQHCIARVAQLPFDRAVELVGPSALIDDALTVSNLFAHARSYVQYAYPITGVGQGLVAIQKYASMRRRVASPSQSTHSTLTTLSRTWSLDAALATAQQHPPGIGS